MVPFVAFLTKNPLLPIVGLVLTFIEINLLAVVAVLFIPESQRTDIAQPRIVLSVKKSSRPKILWLISCFNVSLRADRIFTISGLSTLN
jgi:hypothetical protein